MLEARKNLENHVSTECVPRTDLSSTPVPHTAECRCYRCVRSRLMKPANAVVDRPIDLNDRRKHKAIPINAPQNADAVPVIRQPMRFNPFLDGGSVGNVVVAPIPVSNPTQVFRRAPKISDILKVVADFYEVYTIDIKSMRRTAKVVRPRQVSYYLAKNLTLESFPAIARAIGGRDHTSVLHGVRKIEFLVANDERIADEIELLKIKIGELMRTKYGAPWPPVEND